MIITDEDDQKTFEIPQPKPSTTLFEPVPVVSDVVNAPCSDSDEQKTLDPNFFPEIPSKLDSFPHHLDPKFLKSIQLLDVGNPSYECEHCHAKFLLRERTSGTKMP